jgi:hypothetical protein
MKLAGRYFLSDRPVTVGLTVFDFEPHMRFQVEVASPAIGGKIRERLDRYSLGKNGRAVDEREHRQLWAKIEKILGRDGLSYDKLRRGGVLTRRAIESLFALCDKTDPIRWMSIYKLFDKVSVAKADRVSTAQELIKLFERDRDPDHEISIPIDELACPEIAADLIGLIRNPRHREHHWCLCISLARTRHPQAAEVIAPVVGDGVNTRGAIEALGMLKAVRYAWLVRKCLKDPNGDVRREAKKALRKMGVPVDAPPRPVHLVKGRRSLPKRLEEWSANLDMDDVVPTLQKLSKRIQRGFAAPEIAEVAGVLEEMKPEQTKAFRFPIAASGKKGELWVVAFLDDVDAPDLEIHASAELLKGFRAGR